MQQDDKSMAEIVAALAGQDLLHLEIQRPKDLPWFCYTALLGNLWATKRLYLAFEASLKIQRQAKTQPVLCLLCPNPVPAQDTTLAMLISPDEAADVAITAAICDRCATAWDDALAKHASTAFVKAWPGLRCIDITHPEGGTA